MADSSPDRNENEQVRTWWLRDGVLKKECDACRGQKSFPCTCVQGKTQCPECNGHGRIPCLFGLVHVRCTRCAGTGRIAHEECRGTRYVNCSVCSGTGLQRIEDEQILMEIALSDIGGPAGRAAVEAIQDRVLLAELAKLDALDVELRKGVIGRIEDERILAELGKTVPLVAAVRREKAEEKKRELEERRKKQPPFCQNCGTGGAKRHSISGRTYHFCSDWCKESFGSKFYSLAVADITSSGGSVMSLGGSFPGSVGTIAAHCSRCGTANAAPATEAGIRSARCRKCGNSAF